MAASAHQPANETRNAEMRLWIHEHCKGTFFFGFHAKEYRFHANLQGGGGGGGGGGAERWKHWELNRGTAGK